MKIAAIAGAALLITPFVAFAHDSTLTTNQPEFAEKRPFVDSKTASNPRRIAMARKKQARVKAARLKHKRIKNHRIKQARLKHKRIKMARRKAAAGH